MYMELELLTWGTKLQEQLLRQQQRFGRILGLLGSLGLHWSLDQLLFRNATSTRPLKA